MLPLVLSAHQAVGALPWMMPLVLSASYDVVGRFQMPKRHGILTAELRVQTRTLSRLTSTSRLRLLSLRDGSLIRDEHGSPFPFARAADLAHYPLLFRQETNGTITNVLTHPRDHSDAVELKRTLVSALQMARPSLARVKSTSSYQATWPRTKLLLRPLSRKRASMPGVRTNSSDGDDEFHLQEEDAHGPCEARYSVRRGLLGSVVYAKHVVWRPTLRRPAEIKQSADVSAIVDASGMIRRLRITIKLATNFSGQASGDDDETYASIPGLDQLPTEPAIFRWTLAQPSRGIGRALLADASAHWDVAAFVESPLHVDRPPADDTEWQCPTRTMLSTLEETCARDSENTTKPTQDACKELLRSRQCPDADVEGRLGRALLNTECLTSSSAPQCSRMVSMLVSLATPAAQGVLSQFVLQADAPFARGLHGTILDLTSIQRPQASLLQAMADRLQQVRADDGSLLLLAASWASRMRSSAEQEEEGAISAAEQVDSIILTRLQDALAAERSIWLPIRNASRVAAADLWDRMHTHVQHAWVGHHAQLHGDAHAWEYEMGPSYPEFTALARHQLELEQLQRHPAYSVSQEAAHHNAIATIIRAARNARSPIHAPIVCAWLKHHSEQLAAEAASALTVHPQGRVEAAILDVLDWQLQLTDTQAHHRKPRLTKRLLRTLLSWEATGDTALLEAARHLLRLPAHANAPVATCTSRCVATCNPHWLLACKAACQARCNDNAVIAGLLKQLAQRVAQDPTKREKLKKHIRRHLSEAHVSHHAVNSQVSARRRHEQYHRSAPAATTASSTSAASVGMHPAFASAAFGFVSIPLAASAVAPSLPPTSPMPQCNPEFLIVPVNASLCQGGWTPWDSEFLSYWFRRTPVSYESVDLDLLPVLHDNH
jgi:hypothetical protein